MSIAFAPSSTWVHTRPRLPQPCSFSRPTPSSHRKPRHNFNMVMEKSVSARAGRNLQDHNYESLDALHSRLGIDQLWDIDTYVDPENSVPYSSEFASLEISSDEIPVVGDGNPQTKSVMPWDTTTGTQGLSLLGRRMAFVKKRQQVLQKTYEECRRITAIFSKTFYLGTTLLSEEKRCAVWAIYTWCRRTDDLVDGPRVQQRNDLLRSVLQDWEARVQDIFAGKARDALDLTLVDTISKFPNISLSPFRDLIRGMLMDVDQDRFETFDDLYVYCYRVAGTVGLMTLPIMGTVKGGREALRGAVEPAIALGIGLQLTNILRDVGEDRLRGRIYLPLEDLKRFNYSEADLFNGVLDSRYKNLMKFQIARARRYFRQAQKGVPLLSEDSRLPVQASLDMYSQILDALEKNDYDNFNRRAYISKTRKLATVPLSYLRTRTSDSWKPILFVADFLFRARQA